MLADAEEVGVESADAGEEPAEPGACRTAVPAPVVVGEPVVGDRADGVAPLGEQFPERVGAVGAGEAAAESDDGDGLGRRAAGRDGARGRPLGVRAGAGGRGLGGGFRTRTGRRRTVLEVADDLPQRRILVRQGRRDRPAQQRTQITGQRDGVGRRQSVGDERFVR